jgi:hypothetical protein
MTRRKGLKLWWQGLSEASRVALIVATVGAIIAGIFAIVAAAIQPSPTVVVQVPQPMVVSPIGTPLSTPTPSSTVASVSRPIPTSTPKPSLTAVSAPGLTLTLTTTPTSTPEWVILRSIPAPRAGPTGLVRVGDDIWVSIPGEGRLYRLDLEGNMVAKLDLPTDCPGNCGGGLAWDGNWLWFAIRKSVYQLDPLSGQELGAFEVELDAITGITWDGQALLMIDDSGNIVRYDRTGHQLRQLAIRSPHGGVTGMGWVNGELWVAGIFGDLFRFDGEFKDVGSFDLYQCTAATFPYHLALHWDGNSLWVVDFEGARLSQCAPVTPEGAR